MISYFNGRGELTDTNMIIYFSGTGNSRAVAEEMASVMDDDIVDIGEHLHLGEMGDFRSDAPYVFVCPIYAWRIPAIVTEFIEKSHFSGSKLAYMVVTMGSEYGNAAKYARRSLIKAGLECKGFVGIPMPSNYIVMGRSEVPPEGACIAKREAGRAIARELGRRIRAGEILGPERKGGAFKSAIINPLMYAGLKPKKFRSTDRCNGCGRCSKACPLGNISIQGGRPLWGRNCTQCAACLGICPQSAIEYGKATVGKRRYMYTEEQIRNEHPVLVETKEKDNVPMS